VSPRWSPHIVPRRGGVADTYGVSLPVHHVFAGQARAAELMIRSDITPHGAEETNGSWNLPGQGSRIRG